MSSFGPFVLGGNVFGWTVAEADAPSLLDAFVAGGGTLVDTADVYSAWAPGNVGGESEAIIGRWLARGPRDRIAIATKVAKSAKRPGLSRTNVRAAMEDSLRRLGTDHVDLYYAHEDDASVPIADLVETFDQLVREGKTRAVGASNFTPERLSAALAHARAHGLTAFTVSQDHYNLVHRELETTLLPLLRSEGVVELPYWSLAAGFLTGKYRPGTKVESVRASAATRFLADPKNVAILDVLDELAAAHGVAVSSIALAWLRAQPGIGAPIASARTREQLDSLFESARVTLSPAELERLSRR